jgi:hypothetical protein
MALVQWIIEDEEREERRRLKYNSEIQERGMLRPELGQLCSYLCGEKL